MGVTSAETTGSAEELEIELRDRDCFFVDASAVADCRVELEHMVNRSDNRLLEYFSVEGARPDRVLSMVEETPVIDEARLISRGVDGGLFEFVVSGQCVTTTLADTGAIARSVLADNGIGTIVADVPAHIDTRSVVEEFRDHHQESTLTACRNADGPVPVRSERGVHATMADRLTDKQENVLRTAYMSGYFNWPRRTTAEECADVLGIAQPTFSQHIRMAEEKLIGSLFDNSFDSDSR
jgi:predicted DNA binding protein